MSVFYPQKDPVFRITAKIFRIFGWFQIIIYLCNGLMVARERGTSLRRAVYRRFFASKANKFERESYPIRYWGHELPLFYFSVLWTIHLREIYHSYRFQQVERSSILQTFDETIAYFKSKP